MVFEMPLSDIMEVHVPNAQILARTTLATIHGLTCCTFDVLPEQHWPRYMA